jgi:hypothetical protein
MLFFSLTKNKKVLQQHTAAATAVTWTSTEKAFWQYGSTAQQQLTQRLHPQAATSTRADPKFSKQEIVAH